jgi:Tfp pilus assembly protein PilF
MTRCSNCSRAFSIYYAIGKEQLNNGIYEQAIQNFYKAIKYFKNTCLLHLDLARAYRHVGNEEGFTYSVNRAIEIDEGVCYEYLKKWKLL